MELDLIDPGKAAGNVKVEFPIVVTTKDSPEVWVYDTIHELQDYVELIDVENGEFGGWDSAAVPILLRKNPNADNDNWLSVLHSSELPQAALMLGAILSYASQVRCPFAKEPSENPIQFAIRVNEWVLKKKRSKRPFWRRIFGFPHR